MNPEDLNRLYDAHAAGLVGYLRSFGAQEADARDLLQEVFVKLACLQGVTMLNEKAYLYRLAHNLALNWLRRHRSKARLEEQLQWQSASSDSSEVRTPSRDDATLIQREVRAALQQLPQEQRAVLQLKWHEELSFEQIAQVQAVSRNTAASRHRQALEKLRTLLRPLYEELT